MPKTPDYFSGRTIIITGAASGIGEEAALVFGREGANVLCADMNEEGAAGVAERVSEKGGRGVHMKVDVTLREEAFAMVARARERFGRVNFSLNSAGAALRRSDFLGIDDALWEKTFDLNVQGRFLLHAGRDSRNAGERQGRHRQHGKHGPSARGGRAIRCTTRRPRGAVVTMSMGVGREYADRGIRCMSISPGPIETPFHDVSSPALKESMKSQIPMGRFGSPEEIAELVLFLCSDACEFMTADTVLVNGGGGWK